jgi:tetratricopeptide (TPR) repeat protein
VKPIFISYSSQHRDLTRVLAATIEAQYGAGSVWWDHALESWGAFEIQIRNALHEAKVVVVIWTKAAGESDWVKSEAGRASSAGKLVNVRTPNMAWRDVPSPYDQHHFKNLDDIEGILKTIASVLTGNLQRTAVPLHEVYFRHHGRLLIDPKQSRLARDPREISPTDLLQAKYAVVPYVDVTGMKADLMAWCRDVSRATAGRLVHGSGGLGKTRLMIEVAAALRHQGWTAGFLDRPHEVQATLQQRWQALDQLIAHGDDNGLLMVMDYGEARQDEVKAIAERFSRRPDHDTRPVRLVLLTRSAGEWWTTLHDETPDIQRLFRRDARGPGVIALRAIATPEQRRELFFASAQAMALTLAAQGYVLPTSEPSLDRLRRIERDADHARPLAVQMEALLWLASAAPDAGPIGVDELLKRVLGLERDHWGKLLGALDDDRKRDIARAVAQATVVLGTDSKPSTERLLMADRFYGDLRKSRAAVDPVIRGLTRIYGKPDGGVAQLEPDLIGEHHVAMTADPELIDGCLAWIDTEPVDRQEKRRRDLLTVLQRATHPDHGAAISGASAMLDHLAGTRTRDLAADMVAVMIDTQGALRESLDRRIEALDEEALAALDTALPLDSLNLMELSLRIAERRAGLARAMAARPWVSIWRFLRSILARATAAKREATSLVEQHGPMLAHLAARARTLGIRLANLGRREDALAASRETLDMYRRLAATRPDAFLPDLAGSLNNISFDLSNLGRREEALAASREGLDIYQRLAATHPDAFLPGLARCLNNLGADLSNLGRHEEALAASQEAVDIRRRLAATRPDAFLPDLAMSLGTQGHALAGIERCVDAASAFREGLTAILPFIERHAQAFGDLARNLGRDYIAACEKAETEPDTALLRRVARALGGEADTTRLRSKP